MVVCVAVYIFWSFVTLDWHARPDCSTISSGRACIEDDFHLLVFPTWFGIWALFAYIVLQKILAASVKRHMFPLLAKRNGLSYLSSRQAPAELKNRLIDGAGEVWPRSFFNRYRYWIENVFLGTSGGKNGTIMISDFFVDNSRSTIRTFFVKHGIGVVAGDNVHLTGTYRPPFDLPSFWRVSKIKTMYYDMERNLRKGISIAKKMEE